MQTTHRNYYRGFFLSLSPCPVHNSSGPNYCCIIYGDQQEREVKKRDFWRRFIFGLLQLSGSLVYFYGTNINDIMNRYGDELGCGNNCTENVRISANIFTGVSLICFNIIPPALQKYSEVRLCDCEWYRRKYDIDWLHLLEMVVRIVKINTVFLAITAMAQSNESCDKFELTVSIFFIIFCPVIGWIFGTSIDCYYSATKFDMRYHCQYYSIICALLVVCLPLYIIADNPKPLDCILGCNMIGNSKISLFTASINLAICSIVYDHFGNCATKS